MTQSSESVYFCLFIFGWSSRETKNVLKQAVTSFDNINLYLFQISFSKNLQVPRLVPYWAGSSYLTFSSYCMHSIMRTRELIYIRIGIIECMGYRIRMYFCIICRNVFKNHAFRTWKFKYFTYRGTFDFLLLIRGATVTHHCG